MKRRRFLKQTAILAAGSAVLGLPGLGNNGARPVAAAPAWPADGLRLTGRPLDPMTAASTYLVSGLVRLQGPLVEINGIANPQRITWSGPDSAEPPVARFVSYERLDGPGARPDIQVVGGTLESLSVVPYDLFA